MQKLHRRQLLGAVCSGVAVLAGCSSDKNNGSDGTESGGGAEPTPGATEAADTDGSTDGNDDTSNQFGRVAQFPDSYAMTGTMRSEGRTVEMTGRFYQGDMYWSFDQQGQQMEMYRIGNDTYTVAGGQCIRGSMQRGIDHEAVDPGRFSNQPQQNPDVTPVGRDTIDGEEVLVYEISQGNSQEPVTYYILADSGYPRRIEAESMQWDFHSWGEIEPIQKPEGDCQSMPGGGMTSDGGT